MPDFARHTQHRLGRTTGVIALACAATLAPPARAHAQSASPPLPAASARAAALLDTVRADLRGGELTIEQIQDAERARATLDTMSDAVDGYKVAAHDALGMLFRAADLDTGIAYHAQAVMALAPRLDSADCVRLARPLIHAYRNLAEVQAGHGHPKQALALLRSAPAALPHTPGVAKELATEVARYEMIGRPALSITAPHWLGAPAGTRTMDPATGGAITIVEQTAWWCAACNRSYPALLRIQHRYGADKVHVLLATNLMGRFRADTDLAPNAELAKLHDYFTAESGLPYPVAVADNPGEGEPDAISVRYHVYAIPQVVVVDAHGVVRHILIGWDPGNDARLERAVAQAMTPAPTE